MDRSCFHHLVHRERCASYAKRFAGDVHAHRFLINNLRMESVLEGHTGCVNCLDWSETGNLLASGSDDTNVIVWDVFRHKNIHLLNTQHYGNIFSVKFMPCTSDRVIATGAADGHIFLHDIDGKETLCSYNVNGRVKRLATTRAEPNIIISAAEDGLVREYDIREHSPSSAKVLLDLTKKYGSIAECKCISISPSNPNLIAVGANNPYVCLFDRRMPDKQDFTYFIPGHLRSKQNEYKRQLRTMCVTYVTFNPGGNELLVNLGGEHVYLFDICDRARPLMLEAQTKHKFNGVKKRQNGSKEDIPDPEHMPKKSRSLSSNSDQGPCSSANGRVQTSHSNECDGLSKESRVSDHFRTKGNELFGEEKYSAAISMYNKAILSMSSSVLYSNRAAAFIKRSWEGDLYAALRDCYSALHSNPSHVKAHFRLARCMYELRWYEEASMCIKEFQSIHPEHSNSNACQALEKDIMIALKEKETDAHRNKSEGDAQKGVNKKSCYDYKHRYCGHCNTTTDIKEANYFGSNGQYVIAGSDEGSFFIWERETTNLVRVMHADSSIVNCLQPHPSSCMLATSGIDPVVKLWSPSILDEENKFLLSDIHSISAENQKRMKTDPLESMLISMGMRFVSDDDENESEVMPCRTS